MRRSSSNTVRALAAAALTILALGVTAPAVAAPGGPVRSDEGASTVTDSVETVPVTVDTSNQAGWWRPLDVVDGVSYFAFNAPASTSRSSG